MSEPKITKQDILEKTPGMLQKQLYIVHTKPTNGLGPVMENISPHLELQVKIEQDGVMFIIVGENLDIEKDGIVG